MKTIERRRARDVVRLLAEAEATIQALLSGQIDAVVDLKNNTPVLLARAQEALRASEERYRRIVETTNEGVWLLDANDKTTFMNRRMSQMLGCEADMGLGRSPFEFLDETGRANYTRALESDAAKVEVRYIRADGTSIWGLIEATPVLDSAGRYDGSMITVMDITDRRRAVTDRRRGDAERLLLTQRLSLAAKVAKVGVWEWDLAHDTLTWDATMFEIYGFKPAIVKYQQWAAVVHPDDLFAREAALQKTIAEKGQGSSEFRILLKDGSVRSISAAEIAVLDESGNPSRVVGVNVDITGRKETEAALQTTRYRGLLEAAQDAMVIVNQTGSIVLLNLQAEKQFEYQRDELLGRNITEIVPKGLVECLLASGTATTADTGPQMKRSIELQGRRKDGSQFPIEVLLSPVDGVDGILVTAAIRDISVRKAAEEHLVHMLDELKASAETDRSRKLELLRKDEFLSHVSHELRSPLASIYSFCTIIADGLAGETNPGQYDYLQIILRNVRQLQSMVEDLLEVGQIQTGKLSVELELTSVSEAILYAVDTLRGAAGAKAIGLFSDPAMHLPPAYADPTRLRQILTILIDNAIKFTHRGGAVSIQATLSKQPPGILVDVSDNGCGISHEMAERVFEHLCQVTDPSQAGRKGLGLGLYIAKELVTRQGGEIWVTSELKKGSHFFFSVPIFSMASVIAQIFARQPPPGESIVVVAVEVASQDKWSGVPNEVLNMARKIVEQCFLPETIVLLPKTDQTSKRELFYAMGYVEEDGAEAICKRLRTRLPADCSEQLRTTDFTFAVSHLFIEPMTKMESESVEAFAERTVDEVEECISRF